ncbi:MAG: RidA family protein [Pseudomonadota bacterium]
MKRISSGSPFERDYAYTRAVVTDGWVFVAGTTGYDYVAMSLPDAIEDQCRNTLQTIENALKEAGATLSDVVRYNAILPNRADWPKCGPVLREFFGAAPPAGTVIFADLLTPEMKIEIEVTARLPSLT